VELGPVDRITTDAIGEPGRRTFFIQARRGPDLVTVIVEKQQVQLLARSILEILAGIGRETEVGPAEEEMALEEPVDPLWRVGRLTIGYDEGRDLFQLELEELVEEEDLEEGFAEEPERIVLWATRGQMLALSRRSAAVAARGRPTCRFCGDPIDPEGHRCPAMNGHRSIG
jgi:uncharacterized repeat protein (TIGR03847 family)